MLDRSYIERMIQDRTEVLNKRYRMYCNEVNENGKKLTYQSSAVARSKVKHDLSAITMVRELLGHSIGELYLSEDAEEGLMNLLSPYERHRNYRSC